ncbi:hypothetical protein [Oligoflexus tunisiensis]|uniref:hypothetical protein n=1 Tax=Oligoflexus tunisiensis TaxID=708132 RepID=UPI001C407B14|nr:hypothetical protein [Oligoflexus tunisiensis]
MLWNPASERGVQPAALPLDSAQPSVRQPPDGSHAELHAMDRILRYRLARPMPSSVLFTRG